MIHRRHPTEKVVTPDTKPEIDALLQLLQRWLHACLKILKIKKDASDNKTTVAVNA